MSRRSQFQPLASVNYIDAPVLHGFTSQIPVGSSFVICPNYEPAQEADALQEVPLGGVEVEGLHGQIWQRSIWLMEFSWHGGHSFLSPSHRPSPPRRNLSELTKVSIHGPTTSTLSFASRVYGHVLLDELPLLLDLLASKRFEVFDNIISSPLALKLLRRCTHPDAEHLIKKIIPAQEDKKYSCEEYTALKRTGCCKNPSLHELRLLREMGLAKNAQPGEKGQARIFLTRKGASRRIKNFDELLPVLNRHNFTVTAGEEISDPWQYFSTASIVIGVAGSDLSDSAFMSSLATLFEIHPTDHVQPYNWNVAQKIGFRYEAMLAKSDIERGTPLQPGNSAVTIDPHEFEVRISKILQ